MTKIKVTKTSIDGLVIIEPKIFRDNRGYFTETYNSSEFAECGIDAVFVHDLSDTALSAVDEEYVSFYAIGYLVPYEYMLDLSYLKWRLTEPSEEEIYLRHLEYYLGKYGLKSDDAYDNSLFNRILSARKFDINKKYSFESPKRRALRG